MDQLPLDIISKNFPSDHKIYKPGKKVFRHEVQIKSLEDNIYWRSVETPLDVFFYDHIWVNNDFYKKFYFRLLKLGKSLTGSEGTGKRSLLKVCDKYSGTYREFFSNLVEREDFGELSHMYAPTVPHIFLYPSSGTIKPFKTTEQRIPT